MGEQLLNAAMMNGRSPQIKKPPSDRANPKHIMSVDKRCLSCSGQAPIVLQAFKIACLRYNASNVEHDGKEFSRLELMEQMNDSIKKASGKWLSGPEVKKQTNNLVKKPSKEQDGSNTARRGSS